MPRPLVFGNGEMLVNLDSQLSIRDIYYPYVGWANHVGGHRCRVGVWTPEGFAWLEDGGWERKIGYETDTLVSDCAATHTGLGVTLKVSHAVLNDANIFLQRFRIENLRDNAREIRLFFAHDLRIDESDIGDTAFYDPYAGAMIHYKRDRYFLFGGRIGAGAAAQNTGIFQYACGEKGFRGAEGAWRDAEDGQLSGNAIAQGSVDSVVSYACLVPGRGEAVLRGWMAAGETREEVIAMQHALQKRGFEEALTETAGQDGTYALRRTDLDKLPPRVAELFTRSLLIIKTQADKRGAILASNDSDIMETARAHYSYMWPRDGALVSAALDSVGLPEITRPFFEFCARVLPKDRAALMHKYGPDGTVGASWHPWIVAGHGPEIPFQEDGTALVIWSFRQHFAKYGDIPFARQIYRKLIQPAADFLADFRYPNHLPLPSWDLWGERRGTHLFTTAAVIAALQAASELASELGEPAAAKRYRLASDEVKAALLAHFWDNEYGCFARMVTTDTQGNLTRDMTCDASAYALFAFGVLPADHPKLEATLSRMGRKLWVKAGGGGLARYERDYYFRVSDDFEQVPGNPWIICTLWLADWYIAKAKKPADLKGAIDLLEWTALCALPTGVLPEQVHPFSLAPLSVAPLTWSHAQFVTTACAYLDKLELLGMPTNAK
jgi:GH15 family glucan-1,4-alpha-glucosidase